MYPVALLKAMPSPALIAFLITGADNSLEAISVHSNTPEVFNDNTCPALPPLILILLAAPKSNLVAGFKVNIPPLKSLIVLTFNSPNLLNSALAANALPLCVPNTILLGIEVSETAPSTTALI